MLTCGDFARLASEILAEDRLGDGELVQHYNALTWALVVVFAGLIGLVSLGVLFWPRADIPKPLRTPAAHRSGRAHKRRRPRSH
jgi:hypothetical protein